MKISTSLLPIEIYFYGVLLHGISLYGWSYAMCTPNACAAYYVLRLSCLIALLVLICCSLCYRFDSKRFCRDCRRNVIREFKELKELKRVRREPRCTSWFCVADTAFQYEVFHPFLSRFPLNYVLCLVSWEF